MVSSRSAYEAPSRLAPTPDAPVVRARTGAQATYYPVFDLLRFALASIVCLFHFDVIRIAEAGEFAIQVFFALSGWLIGGILIRSAPADLPRFFFNRGTRIWIPYGVAIVLFYTVSAFDRLDIWWARNLLFDATLTHNLFSCTPDCQTFIAHMPLKGTARQFWTIAAEEQFYLFAPFLILFLPRVGRSWLFWAALGIATSIVTVSASAISFGVAAAIVAQRWPSPFAAVGVRVAMAATLVVLATVLATVGGAFLHVAPLGGVLIVLLLALPGRRREVGAFLGGLSYPLYLNHWIGIFAAHAAGKLVRLSDTTAMGWLGYAIAVAVAAGLYVAVDRTIMSRRAAYFTAARGRAFMWLAIALFVSGCLGGVAINRVLYPPASAAVGVAR